MTKPPFRADHVGSLLRTEPLKQARAKRERGEISAAELTAVEDQEIRKIIAKQAEVGLPMATDGEFRRSWWHYDFFDGLDGVEPYTADHAIQFTGVALKPRSIRVTGKIGFSSHPQLAHFKFVKDNTKAVPKMCIPAPTVFDYRIFDNEIDKSVYKTRDAMRADLTAAYAKAIKAFYDAGCRYIELDDTALAHMCSVKEQENIRKRGDDPQALLKTYVEMINGMLKDVPKDMVTATHLCRGNHKSTFISEGGYEAVAEQAFGQTKYNAYFLEYDTDRAGGFEPLRFFAKTDQRIVLGLLTSKFPEIEDKAEVKKRIEQATKFVPLDRLCLSTQCGFASTEEGNLLTEDQQWAKLAHVVSIAKEVWGTL